MKIKMIETAAVLCVVGCTVGFGQESAEPEVELARAVVLAKDAAAKHVVASYVESERLLREALAIRERYLDPKEILIGTTLNDLGASLYYQSRFSEAESYYKRAIEIFAGNPKAVADRVATLGNLASLYREQRRIPEAESVYSEIFKTLEDSRAVNELIVASILNEYGVFQKVIGNAEQAGRALERSSEIRERRLAPGHPQVISVWTALADLHYSNRQYSAAEDLFRKTAESCQRALGRKDQRCAPALNGLALSLSIRGSDDEARRVFERALELFEEAHGPVHPRVAAVLNNMGTLADRRGDYKRAERYLSRALEVWLQLFGPEHPDVASACSNLGSVHMHRGDQSKAEPFYQRALAIDEKIFGADHLKIIVDLNNLAVLYSEMKRFDEAEQYFDRAIKTCERSGKSSDVALAGLLVNLAGQRVARKRIDEAAPLYKRALAIYESNPGSETLRMAVVADTYAQLMRKMEEFAEAQKAEAFAMRVRVRNTVAVEKLDSSSFVGR
jgi:tetratricopeptide (TPR) repeat protein